MLKSELEKKAQDLEGKVIKLQKIVVDRDRQVEELRKARWEIEKQLKDIKEKPELAKEGKDYKADFLTLEKHVSYLEKENKQLKLAMNRSLPLIKSLIDSVDGTLTLAKMNFDDVIELTSVPKFKGVEK